MLCVCVSVCFSGILQSSSSKAAQIPPHLVAAVGSGTSKPERHPSSQENHHRLQTIFRFDYLCFNFYICSNSCACITVCLFVPFPGVESSDLLWSCG